MEPINKIFEERQDPIAILFFLSLKNISFQLNICKLMIKTNSFFSPHVICWTKYRFERNLTLSLVDLIVIDQIETKKKTSL